jgi:hypothetical protein
MPIGNFTSAMLSTSTTRIKKQPQQKSKGQSPAIFVITGMSTNIKAQSADILSQGWGEFREPRERSAF